MRALRVWHIREEFGYFYSENQYGGFTRHRTREDAVSEIESDIRTHGDKWSDNANRTDTKAA